MRPKQEMHWIGIRSELWLLAKPWLRDREQIVKLRKAARAEWPHGSGGENREGAKVAFSNFLLMCIPVTSQILPSLSPSFGFPGAEQQTVIISSSLRPRVWQLYNRPKGFFNVMAFPFSNKQQGYCQAFMNISSLTASFTSDLAKIRILPFWKWAYLV